MEDNCLLSADLGLHALFTVYCAKGKDFDQVIFCFQERNEGVRISFLIKFSRNLKSGEIPCWDDITEDKVKGQWATIRALPESEMLLAQR